MYTINMLKNDIEAAGITALAAHNQLVTLLKDPEAPAWKLDGLQECVDDALDAQAAMKTALLDHEHSQALASGLCPTCDTKSDMALTYCSACQQSAGERMGRCE